MKLIKIKTRYISCSMDITTKITVDKLRPFNVRKITTAKMKKII